MKDFNINRHDQLGRRIDFTVAKSSSGALIFSTIDPDGDATAVVIEPDEGISLMEWLSEATM